MASAAEGVGHGKRFGGVRNQEQRMATPASVRRVWPGSPHPLGATWDGRGVNFAIYAENATNVELCLFESADAAHESARISLPEYTDFTWHAYLPDLLPGQVYGYRVYGPYDPHHGHRFNHNKIVLDPYAKAIGRGLRWDDSIFGYRIGAPDGDLSFDDRDSAPFARLAIVVDTAFTWGDDRSPRTPRHKTVIYETHVRGYSMMHFGISEQLRGTYAGLVSEPGIRHLKALGITAVELLPVHYHIDDRHLVERRLVNYWGYNTLGFFAPEPVYSCQSLPLDPVREFKSMVRNLHAAGIEVILDVVYALRRARTLGTLTRHSRSRPCARTNTSPRILFFTALLHGAF